MKTGNPNGKGQPRWPQISPTEQQILELGDTTRPRDVLEVGKLVVFDRYVKSGGQLGLF